MEIGSCSYCGIVVDISNIWTTKYSTQSFDTTKDEDVLIEYEKWSCPVCEEINVIEK